MKTRMFIIIICLFILFVSSCSLPKFSIFPEEGPLKEATLKGTANEKILIIPVDGVISDQPQQRLMQTKPSLVQRVASQLQRAEKDDKIKAVILKVNSPGGSVTASDILYHEIKDYKERTGVKIVVAMMNIAASGGYYISLPADWILAHPTTITGSVGVIFARPNASGFLETVGLSMQVNKSGKLKDMGSPFRTPSDEEKIIFQELTDNLADRFLTLVTDNRKMINAEQREKIASARVYLAQEAKELGLVDQIGYLQEAIEKAISLAELPKNARVITFRKRHSEDDTLYNVTVSRPPSALKTIAPVLETVSAIPGTGFYYLWPAAF
ncbi:MAG: signal peptide peptidase SppA [Desulfobacteraceae bacterium]|nr:signal peptide peptidase SppA [Desulfobacteraceae bacterium]